MAQSSDKELPPALSRELNKPCLPWFFGSFDNHDLWHTLSAFSLALYGVLLLLSPDWKHFIEEDSDTRAGTAADQSSVADSLGRYSPLSQGGVSTTAMLDQAVNM